LPILPNWNLEFKGLIQSLSQAVAGCFEIKSWDDFQNIEPIAHYMRYRISAWLKLPPALKNIKGGALHTNHLSFLELPLHA
jgi:hypothetical protein